MKKQQNLLPFENILTAYISGKEQTLATTAADAEATFVFSQEIGIRMSDANVSRMLDDLSAELNKSSLGSIVTQAVEAKQLNDPLLQEKTGLTPSLIDAIKKDMVFTNSVPVKSLVKLLKLLGLEINSALAAIKVTFDQLQTESRTMMIPSVNFQPSYRKGMRGELGKDLSGIKSDESFLYQNEEALNNYTTRLAELYKTL